jgi:hypothetical protein
LKEDLTLLDSATLTFQPYCYKSRAVNVGSISEGGAQLVQCVFFWDQPEAPYSYGYGSRYHCIVRLVVKPAENRATFLLSFPRTAQSLYGFGDDVEDLVPLFYSLYNRLQPYIPIAFEKVEYILHEGYNFSFSVPMDADRYWTLPQNERFLRYKIPAMLSIPRREFPPRGQRRVTTTAPSEELLDEQVHQVFEPFTLWAVTSVMDSLGLSRLRQYGINYLGVIGYPEDYWILGVSERDIGDRLEYDAFLNWKNPATGDQTFRCLVRVYTPRPNLVGEQAPTMVLISQLDYPKQSIEPHLSIVVNSIYNIFIDNWCCLQENIEWYLHISEIDRWWESAPERYEQVIVNWENNQFHYARQRVEVSETDITALAQPFPLLLEPPLFLPHSSHEKPI